LKPNVGSFYPHLQPVTPHTGVWIETNELEWKKICRKVVTPHTGVWIETNCYSWSWPWALVTPHTGVWIETVQLEDMIEEWNSHPPYGGVD